MISRLVQAVIVGAVVFLICVLIGGLLLMTNISLTTFIGAFLKTYAITIGILAAVWFFLAGQTWKL